MTGYPNYERLPPAMDVSPQRATQSFTSRHVDVHNTQDFP
eukprot:CAMPEP_0183453914 /NCGR_PEP_ID=MMETSP0370-20130417/122435_1 /TAXON_ID=268820 /ORGANISM="Peridinium aciculiferum, Strain PAER-2" /LENGTH=39 /DNA_ID= /DNA_START= /DNA_END= /DNA_ORIENTATION=